MARFSPVTLCALAAIVSWSAACDHDSTAQTSESQQSAADLRKALGPPVPPGFPDAQRETNRLLDEGMAANAVAVMERFLDKSPDCFDAHFMLARAHEAMANEGTELDTTTRTAAAREARTRHLEAALAHYRRYLDLYSDAEPVDRAIAYGRMIRIVRADGLNRSAEADALTRRWIETMPDRPNPYIVRAEVLRDAGRHAEATTLLLRACDVVRGDRRADLGGALVQQVKESPRLTPAEAMALLDQAMTIADEMVAREPRGPLGLLIKSHVLGQRTRFESDPLRRQALRAEADRLGRAATEALTPAMP